MPAFSPLTYSERHDLPSAPPQTYSESHKVHILQVSYTCDFQNIQQSAACHNWKHSHDLRPQKSESAKFKDRHL
ncbi:hypothetical protein L484_017170 [Morus notabilis]|uniref:Uncharacterized protein n=1 Tax=Morus notabilis TaxID=981085 RepID=W9R3F3_9ROSA|nr:hypothetical protein L484_017170 [Morus notabilis]